VDETSVGFYKEYITMLGGVSHEMKRNDGWLNDGWLHKQLTTNKTQLVIVVVHSTSCCVTLIHTHSNCASN